MYIVLCKANIGTIPRNKKCSPEKIRAARIPGEGALTCFHTASCFYLEANPLPTKNPDRSLGQTFDNNGGCYLRFNLITYSITADKPASTNASLKGFRSDLEPLLTSHLPLVWISIAHCSACSLECFKYLQKHSITHSKVLWSSL